MGKRGKVWRRAGVNMATRKQAPTNFMPKTKYRLAALASNLFGGTYIDPPTTPEQVKREIEPYSYSDVVGNAPLVNGGGSTPARTSQLIYQKWQRMMAAPLVGGSLRQHCTAALGGHETSGDLVFIELKSEFRSDKKIAQLVQELSGHLSPIFNRTAFQMAYNAAGFGDSYSRVYQKRGVGVIDLMCDEMVMPPLVQAYEKGNVTVAYTVGTGASGRVPLTAMQMARLKMPRMIYTPQPMAVEKSYRMMMEEDDISKLPLMPALAGGSFLADAEDQFDRFQLALNSLVGQRVLDSIDETIITTDLSDMNRSARKLFTDGFKRILETSERIAARAIKLGMIPLKRIRHVLPVLNTGKQNIQVQALNGAAGSGQGRAGSMDVDDVLFHAKLLGGALGTDISQLGFADILSGGLGDGGFFRTSVQSAERSRCIRQGLTDWINSVIDIHLLAKYGRTFSAADRPWVVNFYGSISALESEKTQTQRAAAETAATLADLLTRLRESGLGKDAMANILERVARLDAKDAEMYAADIAKARESDREAEAGGDFPGGDEDDEPAQRQPSNFKINMNRGKSNKDDAGEVEAE